MKFMKKSLLIFLVCHLSLFTASAQQRVVLDLDRTVRLATDSSLSVQKYQNVFYASQHRYLSWMASRKPQLLLESTPVKYERYMTQRYISYEDIDEYRQQRLLYSQAGINATQTMEPWGGQFYGTTQLGFTRTFGDQNQNQFMTIPISVGYKQDLLFYNPLKWARRIEPLKMARAEKELLYGIESTSEKAVEKFFALALAQDMVQMAMESLASSDTIYAIAQRRYKISSISKAELSILELEKTNATTALANARIARKRAVQDLATYLGMDRRTEIELVIPSVVGTLHIEADEALTFARENNPKYLETRQATIEARREAERTKVEKNLSVSLDASIGLNQVAERFADAYRNPLTQDMATVKLTIPILDWGKRKNTYLAARSTVDAAERTEQEVARDTELDVTMTVNEFNERQAIVETASKALTSAEDAYSQTLQRFIRAQADAYSLSVAQSHWQTARQNQINSLKNYWLAYYHLRQQRRSHRKFTNEEIDPEDLKLILRAALMSPTSKSQRAWQFVVVDDKQDLEKLADAKNMGSQFLKDAPVAIVVLGDPMQNDCWVEDQAEELGLGSCWIQMRGRGLDDGTPADTVIRGVLDIPDNLNCLCIIAVGHWTDERKPQAEDRLKWENVHLNKF